MHRERTLVSQVPLLFLIAGLAGLLFGVVVRHPFSGIMGWLLMLNGGLLQLAAVMKRSRSGT